MLAGDAVQNLDRKAFVNVRKKLAKRPLFVADTYGMVDVREVRRTVYDTVQRHGVSMIVIDHLGHLSAGSTSPDVRETGAIVREIKRWSLDLGVHILLIAHLRKPSTDSKRAAQMEDLRGSGEIYQTADNVFLIDRKRASESSEMTLRLVKVRDDRGYEGAVKLTFDQSSLVYSPVIK
jgi:replicative DNA helicase